MFGSEKNKYKKTEELIKKENNVSYGTVPYGGSILPFIVPSDTVSKESKPPIDKILEDGLIIRLSLEELRDEDDRFIDFLTTALPRVLF